MPSQIAILGVIHAFIPANRELLCNTVFLTSLVTLTKSLEGKDTHN